MKRYWKLIAIVTVIVLTIGTFYVNSALSAGSYPEIVFKKESGNEELVEPLILGGNYFADNIGHGLELTAEEATFEGERSFFERIRDMYSPGMKQLQDEYRGFMRGKRGSVTNYLNSEDVLAYVNIVNQSIQETPSEMTFEIDILNKESNKTITFSLPVPNRALYRNAHVVDVQLADGDLKVVTRNFPTAKSEFSGEQIHLYSFDIDKKQINGDEKISTVENSNSGKYKFISTMGEMNEMSPHQYMVFSVRTESGREESQEKSGQEFITYNFEKAKTDTLNIPKKLQLSDGTYSFDDEHLYAVAGNENSNIIIYNLESEKVENMIDIASIKNNSPLLNVNNGKLYVLLSMVEDSSPKLQVFDKKTGDTLYKGKIAVKEPVKGNIFFHFYEMNFKK